MSQLQRQQRRFSYAIGFAVFHFLLTLFMDYAGLSLCPTSDDRVLLL